MGVRSVAIVEGDLTEAKEGEPTAPSIVSDSINPCKNNNKDFLKKCGLSSTTNPQTAIPSFPLIPASTNCSLPISDMRDLEFIMSRKEERIGHHFIAFDYTGKIQSSPRNGALGCNNFNCR